MTILSMMLWTAAIVLCVVALCAAAVVVYAVHHTLSEHAREKARKQIEEDLKKAGWE